MPFDPQFNSSSSGQQNVSPYDLYIRPLDMLNITHINIYIYSVDVLMFTYVSYLVLHRYIYIYMQVILIIQNPGLSLLSFAFCSVFSLYNTITLPLYIRFITLLQGLDLNLLTCLGSTL